MLPLSVRIIDTHLRKGTPMKFRNLLQQADYTLLLPMENIRPLDLILRKDRGILSLFSPNRGSLIHSSIKDLFVMSGRGSSYPGIEEKALPERLLGSDLIDGNSGFAASFMAKAQTEAGASVKRSQKMLFTYRDARELSVNLIRLDEYLLSSKLNTKSPTFEEAVREGNIYIITSVLTSRELELKNADSMNFSGNLSAELLTEAISGSAESAYSNSGRYLIKSKGTVDLTFAIKAVRILHDEDKFRIKPARIQVRGAHDDARFLEDDEAMLMTGEVTGGVESVTN